MPSTLTALLVLCVTGLGFGYYVVIAQKRKSSRVEEFFVAGRNIGYALFTQTTWGSSFAFGNSIFYAVWLGYSIGLSALWIQGLWAIGMICYALLLPRLIVFTEHHTLHGFLGSIYGRWCRIVASLVSVIGLLILLGFEESFVAQYFAQVTNLQNVEWLVVLAFATFVATFCSIGGFKANTVTDRLSNLIACVALLGMVVLMISKNGTQLATGFSAAALWNSATDFSSQSAIYLTGLGFFALFNIVDMTNWQSVSANSLNVDPGDAGREQRRQMRWAMLKATGYFLLAPVLVGTLLGYMLRILKQGTDDQALFMSQLVHGLLPTNPVFAAAILAIVTFAFMASSLAGTDSWLLASTQTLSWDLIDFKKFEAAGFRASKLSDSSHEEITRHGRLILMIVGIGGACIIYYISKYVWKEVFALQFVIFGGGLAMLPSLLFGIFKGNPSKSRIISASAVVSIAAGYGSALCLFIYSLVKQNPDLVSPLPMVALGIASVIFLGGLVFDKSLSK
ncbi:MAG: hypothetical protein M3R69_17055 [Acidobacteriota bacterium]|nr:hypothetical protein [Acidobacteriota bacterium]